MEYNTVKTVDSILFSGSKQPYFVYKIYSRTKYPFYQYFRQIVGYFHDEKAKDVYTHITDDMGTIGIVVIRDSKYKIAGLKKVSIPENGSAIETNDENETQKDNAASEDDGDNSLTLKKYKACGITYNSSKDIWLYEERRIAGLIDEDDVYINERDTDNPICLQISNKSIRVITKKQFNTLINNIK